MKIKILILLLLSFTLSAQEIIKPISPLDMVKTSTPIQASPIQSNKKGIAIDGFDPVAYFTQEKAIRGSSKHSCVYLNRTWHFSSAENRDKFLANPNKFVPQYGGYCAHSIHENKLVESNPSAFIVRDEKLYLYHSSNLAKKDIKSNKFVFTQKNKERKKNWLSFKARF